MTHYSAQLRGWIFVKGYGFLFSARNMGKKLGKNISKNISSKYGLIDYSISLLETSWLC